MFARKKPIHGVGINDADYVVTPLKNGKQEYCPFYMAWKGMISRCYDKSITKRQPTYEGCSVCEEWLTFSNFKSWMEKQDWKGKEVDKDILVAGNKLYSPDRCVMVHSITNSFVAAAIRYDGDKRVGVRPVKLKSGAHRYRAVFKNPISRKEEALGAFDTMDEAHNVWLKRKKQIALLIAGLESDQRVRSFIMSAYSF
jgi:hypothetical protein